MSRLHLSIHARARRLAPFTILALTVATPAIAADAKYFNGAFCRVSSAFGVANQQAHALYDNKGTVANGLAITSTRMRLICPIVRDNTINLDAWDAVEVGYFDRSTETGTTGQIECTVFHASPDGSLGFKEQGVSSNTSGSGWSKTGMVFTDPFNNGSSVANGYYFLRCDVPRRNPSNGATSGIAYYKVVEP